MANEEHVNLLKAGVEGWNEWRGENREVKPDLSYADLVNANLSGADLSSADLSGANLSYADLHKAILHKADLFESNLHHADLREAILLSAKLSDADLSHTNLYCATPILADFHNTNLSHANLRSAILAKTRLSSGNLSGASFGLASFSSVVLASTDLSQAIDLEHVIHLGPSSIGHDTFRKTADSLGKNRTNQRAVETFLRGAGVEEEDIDHFRLKIGSPIEFYSCFISYSHQDKAFARHMYDKLQEQGIRCWLDEHQLLPGDDIYQSVDRGIRLWDKVLLCCSRDSLTSWWVENEIDTAFEKERKLRAERDGKPVLAVIPLNLDDTLFVWEDGRANKLKSRLAADFTGWEHDNAKFEEQFKKVVSTLKTGEREKPPTALL